MANPAPSSPARSNADSAIWAQPDAGSLPTSQNFTNMFASLVMQRAEKAGGYNSYVRKTLAEPGARTGYMQWLWTFLPEQPDRAYHHDQNMTAVTEQDMASMSPMCLHLGVFGYTESASNTRPYTPDDVAEKLLKFIVADGFCTASEPLWIISPADMANPTDVTPPWTADSAQQTPLMPFSQGFIKGMARITIAHCIALVCYEDGIDLKSQHPHLYQSLQAIHAHFTPRSSIIDEAVAGCKVSLKGSVRRERCVIELTILIERLIKQGIEDYQQFVKKFNASVHNDFRISGKKASALKLLHEQLEKDHLFLLVPCFGSPGFRPSSIY